MLEFGKLELVEKTFSRKEGGVRGQAFSGIKFRRYESTKGKKAAEEAGEEWKPFIEEQFVISDKAFDMLNLSEYALCEAKNGNENYLIVVEDQDEVAPVAKFLRQSHTKDGKLSKKGKLFSNEFLAKNLIATGKLQADTFQNQYLSLAEVTEQMSGLPEQVKAVYSISVDTTVDATADVEEDVVADDKF